MLIYIHVPFCQKKCRYCDFVSGVKTGEEAYLRALYGEAALYKGMAASERVTSVFFGGGTPSLLREGAVAEIMSTLSAVFKIADDAEISAEGNPESLTPDKLAEWKNAGINRVSVGVQSFSDDVLRAIGRVHDAKQAGRALTDAVRLFGDVNADLMTGLPKQTAGQLEYAVRRVAEAGVKHVSCYELKLEEKTKLYEDVLRGAVELPDENMRADLFDEALDALSARGFNRYEVSNFAQSSFECRHNMGYWRRQNYIGLGPSAASFLETDIDIYNDKTIRSTAISGIRYVNNPDYAEYLRSGESGVFKRESQPLDKEAALFETVMLGLRLTDGIDIFEIEQKFGTDFNARFGAVIKKYEACFVRDGNALRLNRRGFEIMNMILTDLL
ncbi:MAG: radical SAM family heme chaperone HemW [Clostridiaceae bacterium]|nr:radical SAM family heme chaperone HemW [Clostridiaceae bacterium]